MTAQQSLDGRVALVTGGSRGIGAAIALALAEAGANVAISARDEASLDATRDRVASTGKRCLTVAVDVTEEQWDAVLDTNLKGVFFCSQAVGRSMIARRAGRIVNIASAAGLIPTLDRAAYGSSKAGLVMLTRLLALEWAEFGITVNAVAPTFVETELAAQTLDRPGMRESWTARIPLGRLATTEDVVAAVLYLVSPAASFVTGAVLPVDGGLSMR